MSSIKLVAGEEPGTFYLSRDGGPVKPGRALAFLASKKPDVPGHEWEITIDRNRTVARLVLGDRHQVCHSDGSVYRVLTDYKNGLYATHRANAWGYSVDHLPTGLRICELLRGNARQLVDDLHEHFPTFGADWPFGQVVGAPDAEAVALRKYVETFIAQHRSIMDRG